MTISTEIKQDSIVYISSEDLKYTNLIFAEHSKLLKENTLLKLQIDNYKDFNKNLVNIDSLRVNQLYNLDQARLKQINDLKKDINSRDKSIKCWKLGCVTFSIATILLLILK